MPPLQDGRKFEFVVSTPSHDASRQKQIQRLVRKHVMRPFTRRAPRPSTIILEDEALAEYIAQRQRQRKSLVLYQVWLYCSPGLKFRPALQLLLSLPVLPQQKGTASLRRVHPHLLQFYSEPHDPTHLEGIRSI
jgi:hypothetical protein